MDAADATSFAPRFSLPLAVPGEFESIPGDEEVGSGTQDENTGKNKQVGGVEQFESTDGSAAISTRNFFSVATIVLLSTWSVLVAK